MRNFCTRFRLASLAVFMASTLTLSGCQTPSGYNSQPWQPKSSANERSAEQTPNDLSVAAVEQFRLDNPNQGNIATPQTANGLPPIKVAILLPLSGQHQKLGKAMLNSAQMALFDLGFDNYELLPKDTQGTPAGAGHAARAALQDGAQLVLGPVFSASVRAARQVTQSANVNMIAFSTDWTLANSKTYLIGFMPFDQVERITTFAVQNGYNRIGVLSPKGNYGNAVSSAYGATTQTLGLPPSKTARFQPQGKDLGSVMRQLTNYDSRKALKDDPNYTYNNQGNTNNLPFDAILIPVGGTMARQVGSFLNHYDMRPKDVKRLGTGLMDDSVLATDKSLDGTWFAAPNPAARDKFERRYNMLYRSKPPRIASLAYDATALSVILARVGLQSNGRPAYNANAITNANGFAGVDGIFRFRRSGISERGLAILEYRHGSVVMIDKAPKSFQRGQY